MTLYSLECADVSLRICSLSLSVQLSVGLVSKHCDTVTHIYGLSMYNDIYCAVLWLGAATSFHLVESVCEACADNSFLYLQETYRRKLKKMLV